jgi:hypothetical protein
MLADQGNVCAICKKPESSVDHRTKKIRYLAVDHDHGTMQIRGLLCSRCNTAVGLFNEDIEVMKNAIKYVSGA